MNRVKSGPGPLRKIYEQISALQYDVDTLKSELRLVKRKLNNYEQNKGPISVKDAIVDKIREQQFSVTLTPVTDESVNIVHLPSRIVNQAQGEREPVRNQAGDPGANIYVNEQIFHANADNGNGCGMELIDESEPDVDLENEQKVIKIIPNVGKLKAQNLNATFLESFTLSPDPESEPEENLDEENKPKGKKLDPIWKKYEVSIDSRGKRLATCRKCGNRVSAEAQRLKNHYARTCPTKSAYSSHRIRSHSEPNRKPRIDHASEVTGCGSENKEDTSNAEISSSDPEHISMASNSNVSDTIPKRKRVSESSEDDNDDAITRVKGSRLDPVWTMFNVSIGPTGRKSATCRQCGKGVSGEARRLKHHLDKNCSGVNMERGGNSDSNLSTPDFT